MSPIEQVIIDKKTNVNPIWIMRQAGRYLPEFKEIRKKNTDFIKLCLNQDLSSVITIPFSSLIVTTDLRKTESLCLILVISPSNIFLLLAAPKT